MFKGNKLKYDPLDNILAFLNRKYYTKKQLKKLDKCKY